MDSILETTKNNIKIITFNKPWKKNAIDFEMYARVTKILNDSAANKNITMVVITGKGDFYSSGNDLTDKVDAPLKEKLENLQKFIEAFITFPKLLIAIVNGPAIGIAVTTLAFCDFVFASEKAFFHTPFTKLGIVAEACSTITFPRFMGERRAMKMLLLNYKMPAKEALECGFIDELFKAEDIHKRSWEKINEILNLPIDSVLSTKRLVRGVNTDKLLKTNVLELQELERLFKQLSKL